MPDTPVSQRNSEHYTWGNQCDGWHLVNTPTLSVIQERMPAGTAEVLHFHERAQQFFFVLSGDAVMEVAAHEVTLCAGEGIPIAPGKPHRIRNTSDRTLEFLVISQPHSHGDRVIVGK